MPFAALLAGVLGFTLLTEQPTFARVGVLIGGLVVAVGIAWFSQSGKRFLAYARESYEETKRVVLAEPQRDGRRPPASCSDSS